MNARYRNLDNDPRGDWKPGNLVANEVRTNGHYIVKSPKTGKEFNAPEDKHWSYSKENLEKLLESVRAEEDRYCKAYGAGALEFDHFTELMKKTKGRKKGIEKQLTLLKEKVSTERIKVDVDELCKDASNV